MFTDSLPIGTIHDIKIRLHWSWGIVFLLLTWSLATGYFPETFRSWSQTELWLVAALAALLLFVSVLIHELSHSLIAQREGLPVSSITLFLFGGVSGLSREPSTAGTELRIAAAGPGASIVIGAACLLLHRFTPGPDWVEAIFGYLGLTNLVLAAFNLLPAYPMDGGRMLHAIVWGISRNSVLATRWASTLGEGFGWLFTLGGLWLVFEGDVVNGIWSAMIGWMIQGSASASRHAPRADELQTLTVGDVMTRPIDPIPPEISLDQAALGYLLPQGQPALPVGSGHRLEGMLSTAEMQDIPEAQWPEVTVATVMTPANRIDTLSPISSLDDALRLMSQHRRHELPVVENDLVVGLVSQSGVMHYFRMRKALGMSEMNPVPTPIARRSA